MNMKKHYIDLIASLKPIVVKIEIVHFEDLIIGDISTQSFCNKKSYNKINVWKV